MSLDLTVPGVISGSPQPVADQDGNTTGLRLADHATQIVGQDVAGGAMPLLVRGEPVGEGVTTYNRLLRLQGANGGFFDIGIDGAGTLFVNSSQDAPGGPPILSITQDGVVRIRNLMLPNLTTGPGGTDDLTADAEGHVFRQ